MYFSYPYSHIEAMAGFHIPGDPYIPPQGNVGWIVEGPEEDREEIMEEDPEDDSEEENDAEEEDKEEDQENTDSEPEAYNPPRFDRCPTPKQHFHGPTPRWAMDLSRWSQEQGQGPPYGMERGFYNLS